MASIGEILQQVENEIDSVQVEEAQRRLNSLIRGLGAQDLLSWRQELERILSRFFKKRRKQLEHELTRALQTHGIRADNAQAPAPPDQNIQQPEQYLEELAEQLRELSDQHIFQWSTYYRDWTGDLMQSLIASAELREKVLATVERLICEHTQEIFEKGFTFKVQGQGKPQEVAHSMAVSGLQRFAELAVEHYSAGVIKERDSDRRSALRACASSFLASVLIGFTKCRFAAKTGAQLMASQRVRWFHLLPLLGAEAISNIAKAMGDGSTADTLKSLIAPLACALDKISSLRSAGVPLPYISQYFHEHRRLEVVIRAIDSVKHAEQVETFVLIDPEIPALASLKEAEARGISLVICSLKPDQAASPTAERVQNVLVNINEGSQSKAQFEARAKDILSAAVTNASARQGDGILEYNIARTFPLNNPFQSRYFHVVRRSVRDLLRELEGTNGIRLWCSVRRSGKTTACNDLGGALPSSDIIFQTCEVTKGDEITGRLYGNIVDYIDSEKPIPKNFLTNILEEIRVGASANARLVLIVDEYETLFGRLRGAARTDDSLKYSIVFPLLDQFVAFATENMVVLVGQQPNAHYIFMDQNKLSAYVNQDSFPLFQHAMGATRSEFLDLVERVLTDRFSWTSKFSDSLYSETMGHPFLTVNALVALIEWLLPQRVRISELRFDQALWERFCAEEMGPNRIATNTEYQFFIEAAADAMSEAGRKSNPWLWAVYRALRAFATEIGPHGTCAADEFERLYNRFGLAESGVGAYEILRTGDDANFFRVDAKNRVSVGIPLLARIALAVTPRIQ